MNKNITPTNSSWDTRYEEIVDEINKVFALSPLYGGYDDEQLIEIFGTENLEEISVNKTIWEIYKTIREWKLRNSFKVGSIVICHDSFDAETKGVVIEIDSDILSILARDGVHHCVSTMVTNTGICIDMDNTFRTVDMTVKNYKRGLI